MALQVVGAGHGRTGTYSLKLALERLGFGPCYHMFVCARAPASWPEWCRAYDREQVDFEKLLSGYHSIVDDPGTQLYAQLAKRYPDAKVILTTRGSQSWFDSTQATVLSPEVQKLFAAAPKELNELNRKMGWDGANQKTHDRGYMTRWFESHNEMVKRTIPKERLLVYQVSQAWEPLCRFLGVPVPGEPFPHSNSTAEFQEMLRSDRIPE